ncbi:MAG: glycosyltransferase family 4 protein [Candidatus Aenigmatarchaeota archaeon]
MSNVLHLFGGVRAFKMCKSLAENGYKVWCLTLENPSPYKVYWSHKNISIIPKFVEIYEKIKGLRLGIFKLHFILYPFFIFEITKICKKNKIKIIHAHRHTGAIVTLIAKRLFKLNCKIIFDYHDPLEIEDKKTIFIKFFHKLERYICSNVDFILTQGEEHNKLLLNRWHIPLKNIGHIYNPVDINIFNPKKKDRKFLKKFNVSGKTVLFVGSIVPCFGIHNLIEAAQDVVKKVPDVIFLIRGVIRNQKYYKMLLKEIENKGLKDRFIWLPYFTQEDMAKLIASCDIGVILHVKGYLITETAIPNKIFEYMSSGIPVVANNLPNLTRFVKNNYSGLVCDTDNPKELAKALIILLKNNKLRKKLGFNGRKLCEKRFNWGVESKKLINIYKRLEDRD